MSVVVTDTKAAAGMVAVAAIATGIVMDAEVTGGEAVAATSTTVNVDDIGTVLPVIRAHPRRRNALLKLLL